MILLFCYYYLRLQFVKNMYKFLLYLQINHPIYINIFAFHFLRTQFPFNCTNFKYLKNITYR